MNLSLTRAAVAVAALFLSGPAAQAEGVETDANGMTLYTFDNDKDGQPSCYDDCAAKWPPYLVTEGESHDDEWTTVDRTDGAKQWVYDGKPVYYFAEDKAKGDMGGDGMGGLWHVIKEE